MASPPSPRSPVLRTNSRRTTQHSNFYLQARSLSELALHNLSLADMFEARYSEVTDDDLLDSLAPLGTGVVEEAEQMFHDRCHQALEYVATPCRSPTGPTPSAASSPPRSSTSSASRSRSMADRSDPSYFALGGRERLYSDGGESSYSSGVSTPSLWTDDAVSSYAGSGYGSPLPSTPANESESRSSYSWAASPTLAPSHIGARSSSPAAAADDGLEAVPLPPTIATRRSGIALKLEMPAFKPLSSSPSVPTLRDRAPALLSRTTKSPVAEPTLSPLSAPSSPLVASVASGLARLTTADGSEGEESPEGSGRGIGSKKPSWLLDLEQQVAPTDGIKLKRKPSHVYAF
ncbi:hypothetical protein JCM3774_004810 [Rhodotorula dairenensis]